MTVDPAGNVWLFGTAAKLVTFTFQSGSKLEPEPFGKGVYGNVTAIARSRQKLLAVADALAVYYDWDPASREFQRHALVGADIDGAPTALAYLEVQGEALLFIAHKWSEP